MSAAAYIAAVLADTPLGFWQMQDASGPPVDSSGNGLNMASTAGTPQWRDPGPFGTDFSIRLASAQFSRAAITSAIANFTMELWVEPIAAPPGVSGSMLGIPTSGGLRGWNTLVNGTEHFDGIAQHVAVLAPSVNTLTVPLLDPLLPLTGVGGRRGVGWSYVVVTRAASIWTYYYNGALDTANAGTATPIAPDGTSITAIGDSTNVFDAREAYCAIYTTSLSASQVAAHYAASLV